MKGRYIVASFLSVGMSLTEFAGKQIEIQETEIIRYEKLNEPVMYNKSGRVNLVVGDRHGEMERLDNLNKAVGIDGEDVVIKLKIPKNIELKDGKNMCHNCRSDIKYYAKEAGANSVTVFSPDENVRWEKGSNKWIPF